MRRPLIPIAVAAVSLAALSGCAPAQTTVPQERTSTPSSTDWSYDGANGPGHWSDTASDCGVGTGQSPIDIGLHGLLPDTAKTHPVITYAPTRFEIENNGYTIEAIPDDLRANSVVIDGTTYYLRQFHMHTSSEHEFDGQSADLEIHLVNESDDGQIAVLAVLLDAGQPNTVLAEFFDELPELTDEDSDVELEGLLDPAALLPAHSGIVQYLGSLTTPPCTEGVHWNVFASIGELSEEQLAGFRAIYADNHRPLQPANGREPEEVPAD